MHEAPLVSVLIPTHNHERFIVSALDSVIAETHPRLEVIVGDDGSTDGTHAAAERWLADHPSLHAKLLRHENRGVGRTMNELLSLANGMYVAPLASDDQLRPGGITARIDAMLEHGWRASFGDAVVIDAEGEEDGSALFDLGRADRRRLQRRLASEIIANWMVPGPVLLAETAAIREIGGWADDLQVEDWDLYLRLLARGWLGYVDRPVANYRVHPSNLERHRKHRARVLQDLRSTARRNAHRFPPRQRLALHLQRLVLTPLFANTEYGRVSHLPRRVGSKVLRVAAAALA